jgi:hypothetical protein
MVVNCGMKWPGCKETRELLLLIVRTGGEICMYVYIYIFFILFIACSITGSNTTCLITNTMHNNICMYVYVFVCVGMYVYKRT